MATQTKRSKRVKIQIYFESSAELAKVRKAAKMTRRSVSSFCVDIALRDAKRLLENTAA